MEHRGGNVSIAATRRKRRRKIPANGKEEEFLAMDALSPCPGRAAEKTTAMLVSPKTYSEIKGRVFYFTKEGGSRRFRLKIIADTNAKDGFGYALYRGRYIGTFAIGIKR